VDSQGRDDPCQRGETFRMRGDRHDGIDDSDKAAEEEQAGQRVE
jgi:hypothetical protein